MILVQWRKYLKIIKQSFIRNSTEILFFNSSKFCNFLAKISSKAFFLFNPNIGKKRVLKQKVVLLTNYLNFNKNLTWSFMPMPISCWVSSTVVGIGEIPNSTHFLWCAFDFMCFVRLPFVLKAKLQCRHVYGRKLECVRMCFFNIDGFLHRMPQLLQT